MVDTVQKPLGLKPWKRLIRERAECACERCGAPEPDGRRHHCHHIDRDRTNNVLDNGEYLCAACHADEHNSPQIIGMDARAQDNARKTNETYWQTEEARTLAAQQAHERWDDPAERERQRDVMLNSEALRAVKESPEYRAKLSAAASSRQRDPVVRQRSSEATGRRWTPERRKKHGEAMRRHWADPDYKRRVSQAKRKVRP